MFNAQTHISGFLVGSEKKRVIDQRLERLEAFEALGKEPDELQRMIDMLEDPAPMPMLPDDDKEYSGLLEDEDWEGGL